MAVYPACLQLPLVYCLCFIPSAWSPLLRAPRCVIDVSMSHSPHIFHRRLHLRPSIPLLVIASTPTMCAPVIGKSRCRCRREQRPKQTAGSASRVVQLGWRQVRLPTVGGTWIGARTYHFSVEPTCLHTHVHTHIQPAHTHTHTRMHTNSLSHTTHSFLSRIHKHTHQRMD